MQAKVCKTPLRPAQWVSVSSATLRAGLSGAHDVGVPAFSAQQGIWGTGEDAVRAALATKSPRALQALQAESAV